MWLNPQFSGDLVTFTKEILNGKLHFLCSVNLEISNGKYFNFSKNSILISLKPFRKFFYIYKLFPQHFTSWLNKKKNLNFNQQLRYTLQNFKFSNGNLSFKWTCDFQWNTPLIEIKSKVFQRLQQLVIKNKK